MQGSAGQWGRRSRKGPLFAAVARVGHFHPYGLQTAGKGRRGFLFENRTEKSFNMTPADSHPEKGPVAQENCAPPHYTTNGPAHRPLWGPTYYAFRIKVHPLKRALHDIPEPLCFLSISAAVHCTILIRSTRSPCSCRARQLLG